MKKKIKNVISGIVLFLAFLLVFSTQWLMKMYGVLSPDELLFHLKVPLKGASNELVVSFLQQSVLVAALLTVICLLVLIIPLKTYTELKIRIFHIIKTIRFAPIHFLKKHLLSISALLLVICLGYSCFSLSIQNYLASQLSNSSFIKDNYVDTKKVSITFPEKKRNLIYIYLESMETTYFSKEVGGAQDTNLAPELYNLQQKNISFSNTDKAGGALPASGTGWTIAAMVAQTSGLPLKLPIDGNSYTGYNSFLPGAYTLGDVLHKNGYKQVLLLGSDAAFGGRKAYFEEHGNYEMLDYNWAIQTGKIDKNYHVWWGYEDEKLFSYAKQKLTELSKSDAPFNLTCLTVDTHFPDGYACRLCKNENESQYANVISCSSRQVAQFVSWIQQHPLLPVL
jgi:phosphoglycerol transferase